MAVATKRKPDAEAAMLRRRKDFPTLSRATHFISHSLGAVPRAAEERLAAFYGKWRDDSIEAWHDWLPMVVKTGDEIARLIGAPAGTVVTHQNVSTWMGIIASCLDFTPKRNRVVSTTMNFPSVHYVWKEHERVGAQVVTVDSPDGI